MYHTHTYNSMEREQRAERVRFVVCTHPIGAPTSCSILSMYFWASTGRSSKNLTCEISNYTQSRENKREREREREKEVIG